MKSGKAKKAPKVSSYDMDKNFMRENDPAKASKKKNAAWPMKTKRLSK